jgi:hypothetical protein
MTPRQPNSSTGPRKSIMNRTATTGLTPSGGSGARTGPPMISEPATKTSGSKSRMKATQPTELRHSRSLDRKARMPCLTGMEKHDHEGRYRRRPGREKKERMRSADLAECGGGHVGSYDVDPDQTPTDEKGDAEEGD